MSTLKHTPRYEATPQKGEPGHCYMAQVFEDGKAIVAIEPTTDERIASKTARQIAEYFTVSTDSNLSPKQMWEELKEARLKNSMG